jgi:hypothetical protein
MRVRRAERATHHSRRNPTSRKALNSDLRFMQVSNINSSDESCGKPKATRLREFVLRQDEVFPRRSCGGGTLLAHGFAPDVPEYTHASATLNDTELRKNFRRKNTRQKSFLGHARALNDLPIEVATARPTQRFAAHRRSFVGPRSAAHIGGLGAKRHNPPTCLQRVTADGCASSSVACRHLVGDNR